jgi:putative aldouronate transport system permease protein
MTSLSDRRPVWEEPPTLAGRLGKNTLLTFVVLAVIFPLWSVLVTSLASKETVNDVGGMVVIPRDFDPAAYFLIFDGGQVAKAVWISVLLTVMGTAFSLTLTTLAAYGLSRSDSLWHRPLLFFFLLTFLIYPGLVPSYLVVTGFGLKNSLWALILPGAITAFNLVVIRAFFQGIPSDLIDSARLDGAGEFRILTRIMLPLSKGAIAVVGLFYAVSYWNAFFSALLYIDDNNKWPIQRLLQSYILLGLTPQAAGQPVNVPGAGTAIPPTLSIKMAVVMVTIVPALLVYPFVQRHFTKGVLTGAIKG